ncbi:MAG: hypothetical protein JO257_01085, partial [Deltaproteobacteria bacterium]|nr:hypothetical protein [Deltaproteobacteria bacterium]
MSRAICFALVCAVATAHASPRSDPTNGRAVFTGAATPGEPALELNPAALGLLATDAWQFYAAAVAVVDRYAIARASEDPETGALTPGPTRRDVEVGPGGVLGFIKNFKDRATLSLQIHAAPAEVFPAGVDNWKYHTVGGGQRRYGTTLGASVKLTDELYFGISLALETTYLRIRYARDTALDAGVDPARGIKSDCGGSPCGFENPLATEQYDIDVNTSLLSASDALRPNLGIVYEVSKGVYLGLAYHMPPGLAVQNVLTGTMTVQQAPRDGGQLLNGRSTVYLAQPSSFDAELRTRVRPDLDLHVGLRWEDLSRLSSYDVRVYGPELAVAGIPEWTERPRGFKDPLAMWAGVEQVDTKASDTFRFGGRIGFETSAVVPSRTSPLTIAPTSATIDVGMQVRLAP